MISNAESKRNENKARGRTVAFHKRQGLAKVRIPGNSRHTEGDSRVERTRGKQAVLVCLLCVRGRPGHSGHVLLTVEICHYPSQKPGHNLGALSKGPCISISAIRHWGCKQEGRTLVS